MMSHTRINCYWNNNNNRHPIVGHSGTYSDGLVKKRCNPIANALELLFLASSHGYKFFLFWVGNHDFYCSWASAVWCAISHSMCVVSADRYGEKYHYNILNFVHNTKNSNTLAPMGLCVLEWTVWVPSELTSSKTKWLPYCRWYF